MRSMRITSLRWRHKRQTLELHKPTTKHYTLILFVCFFLDALDVAKCCKALSKHAACVLVFYRYTGSDDVDDFMDIYIMPWCRCPTYFMGILLGYAFHKTGGKVKMHWVRTRLVLVLYSDSYSSETRTRSYCLVLNPHCTPAWYFFTCLQWNE